MEWNNVRGDDEEVGVNHVFTWKKKELIIKSRNVGGNRNGRKVIDAPLSN